MSEEQNDGSWSGLMKTVVGTVGTLVTAGGAYIGSMFFGGEAPAEQAAPAQAQTPVINITTNNTQQQQASGGTKVIERVVEKPAAPAPAPEKKKDEFKDKEPLW